MRRSDLAPRGASTGVDFMRVTSERGSSYEVIVDEVSGRAEPIWLSGTYQARLGESVGTGSAKSLRWMGFDWQGPVGSWVYVGSNGCATGCGPGDRYRLRFYETTRRGRPSTFILGPDLQNPREEPVHVMIGIHREGQPPLLHASHEIGPRASYVRTVPEGPALVTVAHDAPYGTLAGKLVTLDPETGFVSESSLSSKPR